MENNAKVALSLYTYTKAREFGSKAHQDTNCIYDGQPYSLHLQMVVNEANKYKGLLVNLLSDVEIQAVMCACWLHDVIEDCRITYNDLKKEFGVEIAEIVFCLTNDKGRTRKERAGDNYYDQIASSNAARFVKICDRIANATYSKENKGRMIDVYRKENDYFLSKLNHHNDPFQPMFNALNEILKHEDKIIFLDIDGVLNPSIYEAALHKMWTRSRKEIKTRDNFGGLFFYHNCEALKEIVGKTSAKIVISSRWRLCGEDAMRSMWNYRNLAGEIIGITPTEIEVVESGQAEFYDMVCRGMEIDFWIKKNGFVGNYVIIDDTDDMLESQKDFFVETDSCIGLTMEDARKAIEILNR